MGAACVIYYLYWYAKKIKANPEASYTYAEREEFMQLYMKDVDPNAIVEFTLRRKVILTLFCIAFPIMVWGVMAGGWWFPQMAASFLTITIVIMFISALLTIILVLMHSGKGTGVSDMSAASLYNASAGSGILERNLDRLTIITSVSFVVCLLILAITFPNGSIAGR